MLTPHRDQETYAIIGAAIAVHAEMGCGFLEPVYHHGLRVEFRRRGIPFTNEVYLPISYRGEVLPLRYRVDFVCYGSRLVEVKALANIGPIEHAQMINYLRASGQRLGLILNFGARSLQCRRVVWG